MRPKNSLSLVGSGGGFRQKVEFTLPMVERHVAATRNELSHNQIRGIFGERWGRVGRAASSYRVAAITDEAGAFAPSRLATWLFSSPGRGARGIKSVHPEQEG